jgi:hypothetical protein
MWGRKQQKVQVDETQIAAQQQEVWLLQSRMAEGLACGLRDEDTFEAQALLASVKRMQLRAEDREELSARAQTHLQHKRHHHFGVIPELRRDCESHQKRPAMKPKDGKRLSKQTTQQAGSPSAGPARRRKGEAPAPAPSAPKAAALGCAPIRKCSIY